MLDSHPSTLAPGADLPSPDEDDGAIAIVGMALRVPGASTLAQFWANLSAGLESTTFFSDAELRARGVSEADLANPSYVKAFGVLEGADRFDAAAFDMPPREAEVLDPQHRQLLECSWEALEHAGYGPGSANLRAAGRVGVLAGVGLNSYLLHNLLGRNDLIEALGGWQITLGNDKDFAASRVAYKLDLRGPAMNISTACSTSLVATAMGCQSLQAYQSDLVIAGGCSVHTPLDEGYWHHPGGTLSPDGHCRAFDAQAQGTFDGNGVAMVVLKRLADAQRDGDTVHAVIRGFAVNNDGALKVGYTAPSVAGQAEVIREAQEMGGIDPHSIGHVETHGTGTDLGDLIEISALSEAFRRAGVSQRARCAIGSVKTNVGHLDTAAGTASLIKTVLGLQHGQMPASLHFTRPNPRLGLEESPFYVNASLSDWPRWQGQPRRGGVSSFGIGGTNAHVVVEEAPARRPGGPGRPWLLLPVSARSAKASEAQAARLAAHLQAPESGVVGGTALADLAYTLQTGRRAWAHRQVWVQAESATRPGLLDRRAYFSGQAPEQAPAVVFLFSGQDAQQAGMAQDLYRDEPVFRREVDRCAVLLRQHHGLDLLARLWAPRQPGEAAFATDPLPLFVVQYALARSWQALGVQPAAMLGYSLGEYVCACLAGVISLEDALGLAVDGAALLSLLPPGGLLAVSLSAEALRPLLGDELELAQINAPQQCVVGGPLAAVQALEARLRVQGVHCLLSPLGLPFHTRHMAPFLAAYRQRLASVRFHPPTLPYVSCLSGDWIRPEQATDPEHYLRLAGQTVQLAQGLTTVLARPGAVFLEVGPGQGLSSLTLLQPSAPASQRVLPSLRDVRSPGSGDAEAFTLALARLWCQGLEVDWPALYSGETRARVPLPTYAFEHQRYWIEPRPQQPGSTPPPETEAEGQRADPAQWFYRSVWHDLPPLAPAALQGHWLLLGAPGEGSLPGGDDAGVLAEALAEALQGAGVQLTRRRAAPADQEAEWDAVLASAAPAGRPFDHIVYLGLLGGPEQDAVELVRGFDTLLALGRSLGRSVFAESIRITVLADGVLPVGDQLPRPAKAAVLGPLRVLPQEYPNLRCRLMDVPRPGLAWQARRLCEQLLAEWGAAQDTPQAAEPVLALRPGARWAERFEPCPLPPAAPGPMPLDARGSYLITGGLGQIGLCLARRMAERAPGLTLVLTSRSGPSGLAGERLAQVQALQALGAQVRVVAADVRDPTAMAALVREMDAGDAPLRGVIHAAGVVGQASFATVSESSAGFCATQLGPKLDGARVLQAVLGERTLDFCLLCSSLSPVLGGLGFAAYAAANACLDALAIAHNRSHPARWTSVNWEGWRFEAGEIAQNQPGGAVAELGLLPAQGMEVFERILAAPQMERVVVSSGDLAARIRRWVQLDSTPAESAATDLRPRPALLGAVVAPAGETELAVARLWEKLLGIAGISAQDSFFELGGNSLLLTQLLAQIRKRFRLELSLTSLFERPTIADIAALIDKARQPAASGERDEGFL